MMSLPLGSGILVFVLLYALSSANAQSLLNVHSIVLVVVGTLGVLGMATPWAEIKDLLNSIAQLGKPLPSVLALDRSLLELSRKPDAQIRVTHPLISYAQDLWEQGVDARMFQILMAQRLEELSRSTERAVTTLRNLAKYPPALGMTGTVIGLVALFSGLNKGSRESLGQNLAIAMTATFYGLILANMVLMPLADRLYVIHLAKTKVNDHIHHVLMLIHQDAPSSLIEEQSHADAA